MSAPAWEAVSGRVLDTWEARPDALTLLLVQEVSDAPPRSRARDFRVEVRAEAGARRRSAILPNDLTPTHEGSLRVELRRTSLVFAKACAVALAEQLRGLLTKEGL